VASPVPEATKLYNTSTHNHNIKRLAGPWWRRDPYREKYMSSQRLNGGVNPRLHNNKVLGVDVQTYEAKGGNIADNAIQVGTHRLVLGDIPVVGGIIRFAGDVLSFLNPFDGNGNPGETQNASNNLMYALGLKGVAANEEDDWKSILASGDDPELVILLIMAKLEEKLGKQAVNLAEHIDLMSQIGQITDKDKNKQDKLRKDRIGQVNGDIQKQNDQNKKADGSYASGFPKPFLPDDVSQYGSGGPSQSDMLRLQDMMSKRTQLFSTMSQILKDSHDTKMTMARNV
jgi:hypothetical protein